MSACWCRPELVCSDFQDRALVDLSCRRIQADEIWSFVYAKRKNLPYAVAPPVRHAGDTWTWVALCADSKLIPTWRVGTRTLRAAKEFIADLKPRLKHRIQLTTDGHASYLEAVEEAFGAGIDYAQLIKVYGGHIDEEDEGQPISTDFIDKRIVTGEPDEEHISTSYVERQNLTMRSQMRRFTRRLNGFSKKIENHACAVALYTMHYNFCRIHSSLRVTPAMEAGVTDRLWELEDIAQMVEDAITRLGREARIVRRLHRRRCESYIRIRGRRWTHIARERDCHRLARTLVPRLPMNRTVEE